MHTIKLHLDESKTGTALRMFSVVHLRTEVGDLWDLPQYIPASAINNDVSWPWNMPDTDVPQAAEMNKFGRNGL